MKNNRVEGKNLNETKNDPFAAIKGLPMSKKIGPIIAVAFLGLGTGYNVLIGAGIADCAAYFGVSDTWAQQLMQVPSLTGLAGSLVAAKMVAVMGRKQVAMMCAAVLTIFGYFPVLLDSFWFLLFARAIGGFFTGLVYPMGTSLIADYFSGTQKRFMFGYSFATMSLIAGVCLNLLGGFLTATYGWKTGYMVLFIFLIAFFVFAACMKNEKKIEGVMQAPKQKFSDVINQTKGVWGYGILIFFFLIFGHVNSINSAMLVMENEIGTPLLAGTMASFMTAGSVPMALAYAWVSKLTKKYTAAFTMIFILIGMPMIALASSPAMACAGSFLFGMSFGTVVSVLNSNISSSADPTKTVGALSLAFILYNTGQFLTPFICNPLAISFFADSIGEVSGRYMIAEIALVILFLIMAIKATTKKQNMDPDQLVTF